jgi:hypothetical protein
MQKYPDVYAGAYFDEKGRFHILLTTHNVQPEIKNLLPSDTVVHYVQYSLDTLEKLRNDLVQQMATLHIVAIAINEKTNKIEVYLESLDQSIVEKINEIINPNAVEYKKHDLKVQFNG